MSSDNVETPRVRKRDVVRGVIAKAIGTDSVLPDKDAEQAVEVFIKCKLAEWDKDQSGHFTSDEVDAAMQDLRSVMNSLASLKWTVIIGSVILTFTVVLVLGAAGVAMELSRATAVGKHGVMTEKTSGNRIVTTDDVGVGEMPTVLTFDAGSDSWTMSDPELRNLESLSLQVVDGEFFHMQLASVYRHDSGPGGDQDKLEIFSESGHHVRWWESTGIVEIKMHNTTMWLEVSTDPDRRRLQDFALADEFVGDRPYVPLDDLGAFNDFSMLPPQRLLSKGHYVGGVWVHSRGGHYSCDPAYVDGQDDPDMYCDSATQLTGSILMLVFLIRIFFRV